jgi:hypothetical protein
MKLSRAQFDLMEERAVAALAIRLAPLIVEEFGAPVAAEVQPFEPHIRAGLHIGLEDDADLYRFVRCLTQITAKKITGPRLTYVMQALMAEDVANRRLARVEVNIFADDTHEAWRKLLPRL